MAAHSSILAQRIPWTEEPGGLQFSGSHSGTQLSDSHFHFSLSIRLVDISPLYRHSSIISELLGTFSLPTWESDSIGPGWGPGISGDFLKSLQVILMSSWSGEALACFSWQDMSSLAITLWRVTGGAGSGWYRALTRGWLTAPAHTASVLRLWQKKKKKKLCGLFYPSWNFLLIQKCQFIFKPENPKNRRRKSPLERTSCAAISMLKIGIL